MKMTPEFLINFRRLVLGLVKMLDKELVGAGAIQMTSDERAVYDWIIALPESNNATTFLDIKATCKRLGRLPAIKK